MALANRLGRSLPKVRGQVPFIYWFGIDGSMLSVIEKAGRLTLRASRRLATSLRPTLRANPLVRGETMADLQLEPAATAVLCMDMQQFTTAHLQEDVKTRLFGATRKVLDGARKANATV